MKLKNTIIASALLSLTALSAHAAQELTPEKAAAIKPFDRITITGRFNAINEAATAVSRRADKLGADAFYIQDINNSNNGGNWRVTADIYHSDAPEVEKSNYRVFNGVKELPKDKAYQLEPYDTVSVSGFFRSQPDVNDAISKQAKKKGADSFFIVRQVDANKGGNQYVTAYVYKADAPKRIVQSPNAIPADSEAGKAALAAGGAAAAKVEIPGVASSGSPSREVGRFFETQSSTGKRYTVTLADGTKIQEVNNVTAAQMQPFDSVTFTGHFNSMTDVSTEVAKRAAAKGAKYYHVTRQWQNKSGGNLTVSADLFK
ncbi:DUF1471 family protein YdgH [Serratia rhizosphaerae]|uniref:DUF1471 family protein YdgH n=1 Tax=unclassified Serratia (in: enterobacteria) TaxID=2647522 RepID=UPI000CF64631|nr:MULTISPECIES: DUF1471 family protein YdgH [unclassified Serratia (in: enterobacteria)]MBU3892344.1 DUF1471 domain-containing protein [Serratia rubidaea]AVJ17668.1 hypothetical protein CLM71_11250 [Serratia sp. MYb239]MCA4823953.1 DUF1471 domain-containing protein [Serratia rubidaea]QNK30494.1 DUF1471 domain-containing protein [Serratia sp. JUb9]QPT15632.1 DUF1471 domain-containing protein [Serratia rubidaea]